RISPGTASPPDTESCADRHPCGYPMNRQEAERAMKPWKHGNRIVGIDPELRRLWIGGQRLHPRLTRLALATATPANPPPPPSQANRAVAWMLAGGVLIAHDWKDRSAWFRRGA